MKVQANLPSNNHGFDQIELFSHCCVILGISCGLVPLRSPRFPRPSVSTHVISDLMDSNQEGSERLSRNWAYQIKVFSKLCVGEESIPDHNVHGQSMEEQNGWVSWVPDCNSVDVRSVLGFEHLFSPP